MAGQITIEGSPQRIPPCMVDGWHLNPNEVVNQAGLHMWMNISDDNIFRYRLERYCLTLLLTGWGHKDQGLIQRAI